MAVYPMGITCLACPVSQCLCPWGAFVLLAPGLLWLCPPSGALEQIFLFLQWRYLHGEHLSSLLCVCSGCVFHGEHFSACMGNIVAVHPSKSTPPICPTPTVAVSPTGTNFPACPSSAVAVSPRGALAPLVLVCMAISPTGSSRTLLLLCSAFVLQEH